MIFVKTLTSPTRPRAKPMIRVLFARKICFYRSLFSFLKVAPINTVIKLFVAEGSYLFVENHVSFLGGTSCSV